MTPPSDQPLEHAISPHEVLRIESVYVTLGINRDQARVAFAPLIERNVALRSRKPRFYRILKAELKRLGCSAADAPDGSLILEVTESAESLREVLRRVDAQIEHFLNRALTARMVEKLLGITKGERVRWSRDGRLTKLPPIRFRRGHELQIQVYAPRVIALLARDPSIIAAWRSQDAAQPKGKDT